jgi:hypothetical protein
MPYLLNLWLLIFTPETNIILWVIKLEYLSRLFFAKSLDLHDFLPHLINLLQLLFELHFVTKLHLNNETLIIINHEFLQHKLDLPGNLWVVKLRILEQSLAWVFVFYRKRGSYLFFFFFDRNVLFDVESLGQWVAYLHAIFWFSFFCGAQA